MQNIQLLVVVVGKDRMKRGKNKANQFFFVRRVTKADTCSDLIPFLSFSEKKNKKLRIYRIDWAGYCVPETDEVQWHGLPFCPA
jgi:hypothetical protein